MPGPHGPSQAGTGTALGTPRDSQQLRLWSGWRADQISRFRNQADRAPGIGQGVGELNASVVCDNLLKDSFSRKQMISNLVNLFITNVTISENSDFEHPLLRFNAKLPGAHGELLKSLKGLAFQLVIRKAKVQQLERRGQFVVAKIFEALSSDPESLIPQQSWQDGCIDSSKERRVCDYVAGMTDSYAEKLYKRLFQPGFGSSGDEL